MRPLLGLCLALLVPSIADAAGKPFLQGYTRKEIRKLLRAEKIPLTSVPALNWGSLKMAELFDERRSEYIVVRGKEGNGQVAVVNRLGTHYPGRVVVETQRPGGPRSFKWGRLPAK